MLRKIILNWRYYVLLVIGSVSVMGLIGCPRDYEGFAWFVALILSKCIGFLFGYWYFRLFKYWDSRNEIAEFSNIVNMED